MVFSQGNRSVAQSQQQIICRDLLCASTSNTIAASHKPPPPPAKKIKKYCIQLPGMISCSHKHSENLTKESNSQKKKIYIFPIIPLHTSTITYTGVDYSSFWAHSHGNFFCAWSSAEPGWPGMGGRLPAEFAVSRGTVASSWRLLYPHTSLPHSHGRQPAVLWEAGAIRRPFSPLLSLSLSFCFVP